MANLVVLSISTFLFNKLRVQPANLGLDSHPLFMWSDNTYFIGVWDILKTMGDIPMMYSQ